MYLNLLILIKIFICFLMMSLISCKKIDSPKSMPLPVNINRINNSKTVGGDAGTLVNTESFVVANYSNKDIEILGKTIPVAKSKSYTINKKPLVISQINKITKKLNLCPKGLTSTTITIENCN